MQKYSSKQSILKKRGNHSRGYLTQFIIRELRAHTNTNTHKQTYIYVVRIQEVLLHVAIRSLLDRFGAVLKINKKKKRNLEKYE